MKKIKKIIYPFYTLFLPIGLIILVSIYLSPIIEFGDIQYYFIIAKVSELTFNNPRIVAGIVVFLIQMGIIICFNRYNEREYAPTDIYGNYPAFMYYIAWLLGYKKVNLKMKPIPLQYKLLNLNLLNCIDDSKYTKKDYKYSIKYNGKINNKTRVINIVVSDTYSIDMNLIPEKYKNTYTIIIQRNGGYGVRVESHKLIEIMIKEVQKTKKICKEYNLFLTTPAITNISIYNRVFHTGMRDGFILNVYQQNNRKGFAFENKPVRIKC